MTNTKQNEPNIPVNAFIFEYTAAQMSHLPDYAGSAWRGAFGHSLKRTVCVVRNTPCSDCMLKNQCAYSYVFETPPPDNAEKMRKYTASPHPFVFEIPESDKKTGQKYKIKLIIFGHGIDFFPYMVHAMQKAGENGIGRARQRFALQNIRQITSNTEKIVYQHGQLKPLLKETRLQIPEMPRQITINIHTPIRIKHSGHYLHPDSFSFAGFFGNLLRRISMLSYFHTDSPLETNFSRLTQASRQIEFSHAMLKWFDWKRYSSRQKTEMNMGGVIGSLELDMKEMQDFWPYIWLGQHTHVGKATSMGLGHYSIQTTSLPDR